MSSGAVEQQDGDTGVTFSEPSLGKVQVSKLGLPEDVMRELDIDHDGQVNVSELVAYVNRTKRLQTNYSYVRTSLVLTLVAFVLVLATCLGATVLGIQLTKEITISGGTLVSTQCTDDLGDGEHCSKPLATGPTKRQSRTLTSTLPESAYEDSMCRSVSLAK